MVKEEVVREAIKLLKNGNRTWDAIKILEDSLSAPAQKGLLSCKCFDAAAVNLCQYRKQCTRIVGYGEQG